MAQGRAGPRSSPSFRLVILIVALSFAFGLEPYVVHKGDAGVDDWCQEAGLDIDSVDSRNCRKWTDEVSCVKAAILTNGNPHHLRRPDEVNHFCRRVRCSV